jgi:hypothetical protein
MPARDLHHEIVKTALTKAGWTITDDPLTLRWGRKDLFVDLGAEKLLGAEKGQRKIAVEVKSFLGRSEISELEKALGQYVLYRNILRRSEPDRQIYLAIHELAFVSLFEEPVGELLLEDEQIQTIVFDEQTEEILRWIP